jgi:hypothetical protein
MTTNVYARGGTKKLAHWIVDTDDALLASSASLTVRSLAGQSSHWSWEHQPLNRRQHDPAH